MRESSKLTRDAGASALVLSVGLLLGCGGGAVVGADGAPSDAGGDRGWTQDGDGHAPVEAAGDVADRTVTDRSDEAPLVCDACADSNGVDVGPGESGAPEASLDGEIPPPDSAPYTSCSPNPCASGQACWNNGVAAGCVNVPSACEPDPTCLCIVAEAPWCAKPTCTDAGGQIVLTCVPIKKGP